jgi:hypothetical protein
MKRLFGKKEINPNSDGIQQEINEMIVCITYFLHIYYYMHTTTSKKNMVT